MIYRETKQLKVTHVFALGASRESVVDKVPRLEKKVQSENKVKTEKYYKSIN